MAPSATETTTLPSRIAEPSAVKLASNTGPYKELAPVGYEKKAEEEGKDGFKAAKVWNSFSTFVVSSVRGVPSILVTHILVPYLPSYLGKRNVFRS
jgi:hypothetical protein